VSLKELPDATFPGMLENFSTLGFPVVISGQVVVPDQVKVLKSYKKRLQKMTAAQKDANGNFKSNPEAEVAQAQLIQVQRDIISSSLKTAKLSLSVVVRTSQPAVTLRDLERSERELANRTQEVLNAFTHMNGAKAVAETIAKRRIFLGTLPGMAEADKRDQDMLTSNVADLVPVEMPWTGTRRSPLILFETPFRQLIPFSMFDPDLSDANLIDVSDDCRALFKNHVDCGGEVAFEFQRGNPPTLSGQTSGSLHQTGRDVIAIPAIALDRMTGCKLFTCLIEQLADQWAG
jgi:hypothetical protein